MNDEDQIVIDISAKGANQTAKGIDKVTKSLQRLKKEGGDRTILNRLFHLTVDASNIEEKQKKAKNKVKSVSTKVSSAQTPIANTKEIMTDYKAQEKEITDSLKNIKQGTAEINDEQDDTNKKTTRWGKLLNSVKRIAVYRTIRAGIRMVTQAITSSLENIRSVDKELDKSMSNVSNSFTAIKNSFGVVFGNIIKSIEPHLVKIADMFANIANKINEAQAKMSGASTYTKILTSDTKEWQEQLEKVESSLLSFDKFESLTNKDQYTGVVEAPVEMKEVEAQGVLTQLNDIKEAILGIGVAIGLLKLSSLINDVDKLKKTLGTANTAMGLAGIIGGIVMAVKGFKNMSNWDSETTGMERFLDVLTAVLGILSAVAGVLALIKGKTVAGMILGGLAVAGVIGAVVANSKSNAIKASRTKGYLDGGIPAKSELFYMNEYGKPEALVNTGGSQTNVINIDQLSSGMKQGFKDAIYETGLLDAMKSKMVVEGRNIDNNTIARGLFNALKVESERRGGNQL